MSARDEILNRSISLFARRGYEAVGVQEICDAAGVTKPALYYHFGNKEGLLSAVCRDVREVFLAELHREIEYSGDLVMDIRKLLLGFADFQERNEDRYQIVVQMLFPPIQSTIRRVGSPEIAAVHDAVTAFFHAAAESHGNLRGKESHLAGTFLGHAVAFASLDTAAHGGRDERVVRAAQTFIYGIF